MTSLPHDDHFSQDDRPTAGAAFARLLLSPAITAGVAALGVVLCGAVIAAPVQAALLAAIAVGFLGSLAAAAIVAFCIRRPAAELAGAVLGSLGARFVLTLGAALLVRSAAGGAIPGDALLIAVGVTQLIFLAVDTAAQVLLIRSLNGPSQAEAR
ncbi:hypothetical protein RAS1_15580 [Phycisphaerae bacterium RAS1]|nr:hypothetical protein RAS1_15580 [Phycisphaerae bacterium RAS1]